MKTEKEQALERLANAEKEIQECKNILNKKEETKPSAREWLEKEWLNARNNGGLSQDNCWTFFKTNERKKEEWMFQQDFKNGRLYYSYYCIYFILSERFKVKQADINQLVKDVLSKDINCKGLTPALSVLSPANLLSKDINCKGLTPFPRFSI